MHDEIFSSFASRRGVHENPRAVHRMWTHMTLDRVVEPPDAEPRAAEPLNGMPLTLAPPG